MFINRLETHDELELLCVIVQVTDLSKEKSESSMSRHGYTVFYGSN